MSPKLLVIMGATGNQGRSIISSILSSPSLSSTYTLRALTRSPSSSSARALSALGITVVSCDPTSPSSLLSAFTGGHTIFGMTTSFYDGSAHAEAAQGKAIVDAAIAASASYFIWSTLPSPMQISDGKYTHVTGFEDKAAVEVYLRGKSKEGKIRSAFCAPGSFMQNFARPMMEPVLNAQAGDGSYVIFRLVTPEARIPLVDIAGDTGKFVAAILAEPERFEGKTVFGAGEVLSMRKQAELLSRATGKKVQYVQIPVEAFKGFLPEGPMREEIAEMLLYQEEFGYYGKETEEGVAWSRDNAVGKVKGFEEWLMENPLGLE